MAEVSTLNYRIYRLTYSRPPLGVLTYKIFYIAYDTTKGEDYTAYTDWILLGGNTTTWKCDINGIFIDPVNIPISSLSPFTTYILKFLNTVDNNIYCCKFTTGLNIGLDGSPYYNKVLFPGLTYDWYVSGLNTLNNPTCIWYYKLLGNKNSLNVDSWPNIMDMPIGSTNDEFLKVGPEGNKMLGIKIGADSSNNRLYCALPFKKYDPTTKNWVTPTSYWTGDGEGAITAYDVYYQVVNNSVAFGFGFYVDSSTLSATATDSTLCLYSSDSGTANYFRLFVDYTNGVNLKYTTNGNDSTLIASINKDIWYYIVLWKGALYLYYLDLANNRTIVNISTSAVLTLPSLTSKSIPFCFGDNKTTGIVINNVVAMNGTDFTDTNIDKLIDSLLNTPVLNMALDDGSNYTLSASCTTKIASDMVSFLIPNDLFSSSKFAAIVGKGYTDIPKITLSIYSHGAKLTNVTSRVLLGFSYTNATDNTTVKVGALVNPSTYLQDSFDIDFLNTDSSSLLTKLSLYFFTKHGTWGGYNGGTNGNLIYFNGDKNLVIEAHGDSYNGTITGIGKESALVGDNYTGYGTTVPYDQLTFDSRLNKSKARTGAALVSNKYMTYGRMDVWMKIPMLKVNLYDWGVCAALWFFHYIEVGENDPRYSETPYSYRNKQGSVDDGYYRVVNNEIDIELPSHLTLGTISTFADLSTSYFDTGDKDSINKLDSLTCIGVDEDLEEKQGLYYLNNPEHPELTANWLKAPLNVVRNKSGYDPRYLPSFRACKFNNWLGELRAGDGWCKRAYTDNNGNLPPTGSGITYVNAEDYYYGISENTTVNPWKDTDKEEYQSKLTYLATNWNGYADNLFHLWSIVWLPSRTLLLIDDNVVRENYGFIPFNIMKFTIALWFPTMPVCDSDGKNVNVFKNNYADIGNATGVKDKDGIYGTKNKIMDVSSSTPIGTWAGNKADWEVLHLEVSRIKYTKFADGYKYPDADTIDLSQLSTLGESFPESGLRMFTTV